jgi:hypothetical protein
MPNAKKANMPPDSEVKKKQKQANIDELDVRPMVGYPYSWHSRFLPV